MPYKNLLKWNYLCKTHSSHNEYVDWNTYASTQKFVYCIINLWESFNLTHLFTRYIYLQLTIIVFRDIVPICLNGDIQLLNTAATLITSHTSPLADKQFNSLSSWRQFFLTRSLKIQHSQVVFPSQFLNTPCDALIILYSDNPP